MERAADALTIVLSGCAIIVTALVVRRELFPPLPTEPRPVVVEDFDSVAETSRWLIGDENSLVRVIEFIDFQCPFCAEAERRLRDLAERSPGQLGIGIRHFPLPIHAHATDAAVASECAGSQDRYREYHHALFEGQREIGTTPWSQFAIRAGVPDLARFERCLTEGQEKDRVFADKVLGESMGVRGTPAFVVSGELHRGLGGLDAVEAALLRGTNREGG